MIYQLKRAIPRLDRSMCTVVTIREYLTAGDVLAQARAGEGELLQSLTLLGKLTGLDMMEVESLDVEDVNAIMDQISKIITKEAATDPKA
jgi:hypothetical protein